MPDSLNNAAAAPPQGTPLLPRLVGYRLRRASGRMMNDFRARLAPLGVRPVLFAILDLIRAEPGIIQMSVGAELGIQRANLVPLINELVQRALIERRVAAHDRRALSLYLTQAGVKLLQEATNLVLEHEETALAALTFAERHKLSELLDKVAAGSRQAR